MPPIDMLAQERKYIYVPGKRIPVSEVKRCTMNAWQERWRTREWTRKLIPNIERWIKCQHRRVEQVLTGHGVFRAYATDKLAKLAKTNAEEGIFIRITKVIKAAASFQQRRH